MKNLFLFVLPVIVSFCSTISCSKKEKEGHICFRTIDSNKDGVVTFQDFQKYYGDDKVKFNSIDLNKDGKLNHEEYHKSLGHGAL